MMRATIWFFLVCSILNLAFAWRNYDSGKRKIAAANYYENASDNLDIAVFNAQSRCLSMIDFVGDFRWVFAPVNSAPLKLGGAHTESVKYPWPPDVSHD